MTQSTENNSYFTLNNPSINNKPQPTTTTTKSGLLNRRQQHASYLPQLELPSLPPLSQLLTTDKVKKENATNPSVATIATTTTSDAAVAAAVAAGMMPNMNYSTAQQQQQQQPLYYNNTNDFNNANSTVQPYATTNGTTNILIDPITTNTNPATTTFATNNTMIPLDSMYNLQVPPTAPTDPATAAAAMAAAAAANAAAVTGYMKYEGLPQQQQQQVSRQRQLSNSSLSSAEKIYSFVAIPGTNQKKRPRRRYDEIERLYHCNWVGCTKAYGTLNHLNAHVSIQKHGPKRHPAEFKEMRKEWRRQKKEREANKKANEEAMNHHHHHSQPHMMQQQQSVVNNNNNNSYNNNHFQPYGQLPTGAMSLNGFY